MFCWKCGEEIEDDSKFCEHCGSSVQQEALNHNEPPASGETLPAAPVEEAVSVLPEPENPPQTQVPEQTQPQAPAPHVWNSAGAKVPAGSPDRVKKTAFKWQIPVIIGAVVLIALTAMVLIILFVLPKKTEQAMTVVSSEVSAMESKPSGGLPDEQAKAELADFISLLAKIDAAGSGKNFSSSKDIDSTFATSFMIWSVWTEVPFADGKPVALEGTGGRWNVSAAVLGNYMKNSIGLAEASADVLEVEGETAKIAQTVPTVAYGSDVPQITGITQLADDQIQVDGAIRYTPEFMGDPYTTEFSLIFRANSASMWGGYTLEKIDRWSPVQSDTATTSGGISVPLKTGSAGVDANSGISKLVHLLGEIDYRGTSGPIDGLSQEDFGSEFMFFSLWDEYEFVTGKTPDYSSSSWELNTKDLQTYLQNSIGSSLYGSKYIRETTDTSVKIGIGNPPGLLEVGTPVLGEMKSTAGNLLQVSGTMDYLDGETGTRKTVNFELVLSPQANSIWGGYCLQSIERWDVGTGAVSDSADYILPDVDKRLYTESDLNGMDARALYLARNEVYARHGHIFKKQELTDYFSEKAWYHPTKENVTFADFNDFEKKNVDLIVKLEEKFK